MCNFFELKRNLCKTPRKNPTRISAELISKTVKDQSLFKQSLITSNAENSRRPVKNPLPPALNFLAIPFLRMKPGHLAPRGAKYAELEVREKTTPAPLLAPRLAVWLGGEGPANFIFLIFFVLQYEKKNKIKGVVYRAASAIDCGCL